MKLFLHFSLSVSFKNRNRLKGEKKKRLKFAPLSSISKDSLDSVHAFI